MKAQWMFSIDDAKCPVRRIAGAWRIDGGRQGSKGRGSELLVHWSGSGLLHWGMDIGLKMKSGRVKRGGVKNYPLGWIWSGLFRYGYWAKDVGVRILWYRRTSISGTKKNTDNLPA
jgi:hypothetical protein